MIIYFWVKYIFFINFDIKLVFVFDQNFDHFNYKTLKINVYNILI